MEEFYDTTDRKDFMTYAKEAIGQIKLEVKFKKLDDRAVIPSYAHDGDVGMDLTAISVEYDESKDMYIYHTGLAFETDKHYGIFLFPRSSNRKTDAYLCNHVGISDSAIYRGEIILCFKNRTSIQVRSETEKIRVFFEELEKNPITISHNSGIKFTINDCLKVAKHNADIICSNPMDFAPYNVGDRIVQMVVLPYPDIKLIEYNELTETERGDRGFGSTGK